MYQDNVDKAVDIAQEAKPGLYKGIACYAGEENLWKKMLTEVQPDVVFISTNWINHAPMTIAALEAGAHTFVEVPLALTLEELWAIVDAAEKAQRHCMMMENVNYSRDELLFLNMCRQGLVGTYSTAKRPIFMNFVGRWKSKNEGQALGVLITIAKEMEIYTQPTDSVQ